MFWWGRLHLQRYYTSLADSYRLWKELVKLCGAVVQPGGGGRPLGAVGDDGDQYGAGRGSALPRRDVERRRDDELPVHLAARQLPVLDVLPRGHARAPPPLPRRRLQRHARQRRGDSLMPCSHRHARHDRTVTTDTHHTIHKTAS